MRDVVVIGGGLTGLSACYQLEKLGVDYTVIELKRQFGGMIRSASAGGFVIDADAFAFTSLAGEPWLSELGLADDLLRLTDDSFIFRAGTGALIHALAASLRGGRLMRMAVSSLGRDRRRFSICLENGLMLDAGALVVAVPARYAVRMLYNLAPGAADQLEKYRYENIWLVALGIHKRDLPPDLDADLPFVFSTDHSGRVPDRSHCLIQTAISAAADRQPDEIIQLAAARLGIISAPIVARAQPMKQALSPYESHHPDDMRLVRALLHDGICLAGSDYLLAPPARPGVAQLAERLQAGRLAAQAAAQFLRARKLR